MRMESLFPQLIGSKSEKFQKRMQVTAPSFFVPGDPTVVNLLWPGGVLTANVAAFSLQDAIDYASFLIRTTSEYQRFSGKWQTVGGDIDIALITNRNGFQWIKQKPLYKMLAQPT